MKIKKKISFLSQIFLVLILCANIFGPTINAMEGINEFDITSVVNYNDEKTTATMTFDQTSVDEEYSLISIQNPDETQMDLVNGYEVSENGTYDFVATYSDKQEPTKELTLNKTIEITELQTFQEVQPATSIVSDGVTISIPNYDGIGWANEAIKNVDVSVDFADVTSTDKKLEITVPEGMRFEQISINGTADKTGVDANILSNYGATDPLYIGITGMELPKKETAPMGATFGKITYHFAPGVEKATISIKVSVDSTRYYGPHTVPNPISATATKGASNELIGETSQVIHANGTAVGGNHTAIQLNGGTISLLTSTVGNIQVGTTRTLTTQGLYDTSATFRNRYLYVKNIEAALQYPVGTELVSMAYPTHQLLANDPTTGTATYTYNGWVSQINYRINYQVPVGLPAGVYPTSQKEKFVYTWYDGTTQTVINNNTPYSVTLADSFPNKVTISDGNVVSVNTGVLNHQDWVASIMVINIQGADLTNQTFETQIDANFKATKIYFPFDKLAPGNNVTQMYYQTNKNSSWRPYTGAVTSESNLIASITRVQAGLDSDEYFTAFKANVGVMRAGFRTSSYQSEGVRVGVVGMLDVGSSSANIVYSLYDDTDATTKADTLVQTSRPVVETVASNQTIASSSSGRYGNLANTSIGAIVAGDSYKVIARIQSNDYYHAMQSMQALENPELYLREPAGQKINLDSLVIKDQSNNIVDYTVDTKTNNQGETVYTVKTQNSVIGSYFDEKMNVYYLNVEYAVATTVKASGEYKLNDMLSWGKSGVKALSLINAVTIADTYDLNGNGDTTEPMLPVSTNTMKISENKNVLVETFLSLAGEAPKDAYVDGDTSTLAYFTPGTQSDYTVKISNNGDVPADAVSTYIPIPKTGKSFGTSFQNDTFKWDMTLTNAVVLDPALAGKFEVQYSVDANESNYSSTATYSATPPANLSNVTMVKVVALVPMAPAATADILVPLKVNETFDTAMTGNKVGTRDIFNPIYAVDSVAFKGILPGTKVGTELVIAEIGGTVFTDKNADGLYKTADGDTLIEDHEVELYKWNETTSKYEAVLNASSQPVKTTTDANGVYLFDYTVGMGYGKYAVKFVEKTGGVYQYTIHNPVDKTIDSDAILINDSPNAGDQYKGWVLDIDATKPAAKTIGAGFLAYNPPVDLKVDITKASTSIKMSNTQHTINELLAYTVAPTFFDKIKSPTDAYTWSSSNPAIVSVNSGSISGLQVGTATITLTIKDVYGNTTSDTIEVTVTSNNIPVITAVDTTLEAMIIFEPLTLVTANDVEDASLTIEVIENTVVVNKLGTYKVTYKVTDSDSNVVTKTINVVIQDTINPVVRMSVDKPINPTLITIVIVDHTATVTTWEVVDANNVKTTGTGTSITIPTVDGVYTANVKVVDEAGNEGTATSSFTVDKTAPTLQATTATVTVEASLASVPTDWKTIFGVTSVDALDGDITNKVTYTVDPLLTAMNVPGTYTILANSTDVAGNSAPTLTLTYTITNSSLPVLSSTETLVEVEASRNPLPTDWQTIFGVGASDIVDGDITNKVIYTVDPLLTGLSIPGTYTILANVKNSANTAATTLTLTYKIEDTLAPNLTATTPTVSVEASLGALPTDWKTVFGTSSIDAADGDITGNITYSVDPLLTAMNIPGTYTITANSTDAAGNSAPTLTLTYTITHTSLPVITATETTVTVEATNDAVPTNWQTIFGVGATDIVDGDVTANIVYTVDPLLTAMNIPGTYTIQANVKNSSNTAATTQVLTFIVEDTTNPILTTTIDSMTVKAGTAQPTDLVGLFGIVATDTLDGDIIASLQATPNPTTIDMNTLGTTIITLSVADKAGNTATKTVSFTIEPIILSGTVFSDENYDGTADEHIGMEGVTIELYDPLTTTVVMSTVTNNVGAYTFEGVTLGSTLAIRVQTPTGCLLAPMSNTSLINPDTGVSNTFTITAEDQTELNIGVAPEYIIHISPTEKSVYLGKTASLDVHVEDGSVSSATWQQNGIATAASTPTGYDITGTAVGTDYIIFTIADGYGRETTKTRAVPITVTESSLTTDKDTQEAIMARPFIIKEASIATMQLTDYIEQAKAKAWSIAPATLNQPVEITSMSSLSTERDMIQQVTFATTAGTYITLDVVVSTEDNINDNQEVATGDVELLAANNKVETYDFVDTIGTLDDETLRTWSDVNLYSSELSIKNMLVQDSAFAHTETDRVIKMSGTYPVTFKTNKGGEITSYTTIKHPDSSIIENGEQAEIIEARDIEIDINAIATLTEETIHTLTQVDAWKTRTWTTEGFNERVGYQVDYSSIQAEVGQYPVQYTTSNGTMLEITATVVGEKTPVVPVLPTTGLNTMFFILLGGAITLLSIILLFTKKMVKKLR